MCDSALTPIGICPQKFTRKLVAAGLVALAFAAAGCGGDDEPASTAPTATAETETETTATVTTPTETQTETAPAETTPATPTETSPEDQPGGAGDEEPARTLALFTARGGQISAAAGARARVHLDQVRLRSADGGDYALRFGDSHGQGRRRGHDDSTACAPASRSSAGRSARATASRISATAEPGP